MNYQEIHERIIQQAKDRKIELQSELLSIIPDAKNIEFSENKILFKSKGNDKRDKQCIGYYDNNGIKTILKQIDTFKQIRCMTNGQPISNCKTIY